MFRVNRSEECNVIDVLRLLHDSMNLARPVPTVPTA